MNIGSSESVYAVTGLKRLVEKVCGSDLAWAYFVRVSVLKVVLCGHQLGIDVFRSEV